MDVGVDPVHAQNHDHDREQRLGSPDDYCAHKLYVEPDGSFSIVALVWRPGQIARIHDHVTWRVLGVIQGTEHEDVFDADLNHVGHTRIGSSARRYYD